MVHVRPGNPLQQLSQFRIPAVHWGPAVVGFGLPIPDD